jgi:hypothetical protein
MINVLEEDRNELKIILKSLNYLELNIYKKR